MSEETEYEKWIITPLGKPIRLMCEPAVGDNMQIIEESFSWFQYGNDGNLIEIEDEHGSYIDTPQMVEPEIRKYCCITKLRCQEKDEDKLLEQAHIFYVAYTGIPTVYIDTDEKQPIESKVESINGIIRIVSSEYGQIEMEIEIKGRGNTGWYGTPKKSYNIKLTDKQSILGMEKSKKWALIDSYHDRSLLRNSYVSYLAHNIFTNLGWNPSYVHVDLILNGEYVGNYLLAERNKIEKHRINIPDISKVDRIEAGGFLCEINERLDEVFNFRTTHGSNAQSNGEIGVAISLKDPDEVSEDIQKRVQQVVQAAEDALYSDNFKDPKEGYRQYFDIDALVDWYILHEYVCMYDASSFFTSAYFWFEPTEKKIHMGPCWDYDTAMRVIEQDFQVKKLNTWYTRLWEDEYFVNLVYDRWNEIEGRLQKSISKIEEYARMIEVSANYNFLRWPILGTPYEGIEGWENLNTYTDQVDYLISWVKRRISFLNSSFGVVEN